MKNTVAVFAALSLATSVNAAEILSSAQAIHACLQASVSLHA